MKTKIVYLLIGLSVVFIAATSYPPLPKNTGGASNPFTNMYANGFLETNYGQGSFNRFTNGTLQVSNNLGAAAAVINTSNVFEIDTTQTKKTFQVDTNGDVYATNMLRASRFSASGGTIPTVVTNNAMVGPGAGATVTIGAGDNDTRMTVTLLTSGTPAASATNFTVTFGTAKKTAPTVIFCAANVAAGALITRQCVTNVTTTGFNFLEGASALTATTTYMWSFWVIE